MRELTLIALDLIELARARNMLAGLAELEGFKKTVSKLALGFHC